MSVVKLLQAIEALKAAYPAPSERGVYAAQTALFDLYEAARAAAPAQCEGDRQVSALDAMKPTEQADIEFLLSALDQRLLDSISARQIVRDFRKQIIQVASGLHSPAACAAADVLERVAALNSSDPATDDLTVHLAIELADKHRELAQARAQIEDAWKQAFAEAMDELDKLRTLAATDFKSPNCQGQRGADRTDAFYDAYHAIRKLSDTLTNRSSAPAAPTGDTQSGERPPASAAMGHSAGAEHTPRKAYRLGKEAAREGKTLGCNPYSRSDHRESWADGWNDEVNGAPASRNPKANSSNDG